LEESVELAEIAGGRLRDIPEDRLERAFVDAFSPRITRRSRFLGGESFGSLVDRVVPAFQRLSEEPGWRCLLLVLHGAVNRAILAHTLGLPLRSFGTLEQDACCINILDVGVHGPILRLANHTPYDPAKVDLMLTSMESLYRQYRPSADTSSSA
jgi:probable phosphoglycerate mutase